MSVTWNSALASAPGTPPYDDEGVWLLDYDLASHNDSDLLASLPLSAVLPDRLAYAASPVYQQSEDDLGSPTYNLFDDGSASPAYRRSDESLSSPPSSFYGEGSDPASPVEAKPSRAELASKLLNELDELKEEPFSEWLEEKMELPFEDFSSLAPVPEVQMVPHQYEPLANVTPAPPAPEDTQALLMEFDSIFGAVEMTHLTPPQSPPTMYAQSLDERPATQFLLALQAPYAQVAFAPPVVAQQPQYQAWVPPVADDMEQELAAFDELVRSHAEAPQEYTEPPSPGSTTNSSYASSEFDDEYTPPKKATSQPKRSKPYSRSTEDKRSRKKEQNKNAATRYRLKKKAESEVILSEERGLRDKHSQLDTKCADLQREIKYLKGLMRDLFKAKGLIK